MSPLRFFGSLVVGRLSSHRIRAGSAWLIHQSRNIADHVMGSGSSGSFPKGDKLHASILPVGTLSSALVGGMLYFKEDAEETSCGLTDADATKAHGLTDEDPAKEAALKARFKEWMVKYERRYQDEEEKALRFREFKRHVKDSEKANALGGGLATFEPNGLGGLTEEEGLMLRTGSYDMTARRYIAKQRDMVYQRVLECFPKGGKLHPSILLVGTLSSTLVGGMLYFKEDTEETACGLTDADATKAHELTDEDPMKEADLKARFEEWMIKYERRYKDEEEKALRFREFKRHVKDSEKATALGGGLATFGPNDLGDLTVEEGLMRRTGSYDMTARRYIARQRDMVYQRVLEWWYQL